MKRNQLKIIQDLNLEWQKQINRFKENKPIDWSKINELKRKITH